MNKRKLTLGIVAFAIILFGGLYWWQLACQCHVTRAAFDIGSGSIKLRVAKVDKCEKQVLKVIYSDRKKVGFKQALATSKKFSKEIEQKGLEAIAELIAKAKSHKASEYAGVATAAFRESENGNEFINLVNKEFQLNAQIITQKQEAIIGFLGAKLLSVYPEDEIIVWDIGGGSMQMVTLDENNTHVFYNGDLASLALKNFIIKDLKKLNLNSTRTPNPMGEGIAKDAIQVAHNHAFQFVSPAIKKKVLKHPDRVIGIGGVHYYSMRSQLHLNKGQTYSVDQVFEALKERQDMTDKQVGGQYADTDVSNLVLVYGYMRALGIKSVLPAEINLTDGLLVSNTFWKINH